MTQTFAESTDMNYIFLFLKKSKTYFIIIIIILKGNEGGCVLLGLVLERCLLPEVSSAWVVKATESS